jgi:hypothetical protein
MRHRIRRRTDSEILPLLRFLAGKTGLGLCRT